MAMPSSFVIPSEGILEHDLKRKYARIPSSRDAWRNAKDKVLFDIIFLDMLLLYTFQKS